MKKILKALTRRNTKSAPSDLKVHNKDSLEFGFLDGFLSGLLSGYGPFAVLQVGANDGVTVDPIRPFLMRNRNAVGAVLVEPLPDVFEALTKNYAEHSRVRLVNAAVGASEPLTLYRIKSEYTDRYSGIIASGITSFDRNFVLKKSKHLIGIDNVALEDRIEEVVAPSYTATQLILDHEDILGRNPFLQIDAEGYDDQVVRSIDFTKTRPIAISYEISNIDDDRLTVLKDTLENEGYRVIRWSDEEELAVAQ